VLHFSSKNKIEIDSKKQQQEIEHDKKKYWRLYIARGHML
jgi:hypothetical protein